MENQKSKVYVLLDERNHVLRCEGGACMLQSEEELAADRDALPKPQPSQLDRVEAQATYTAMMTDTMM